MLDVFKNVSKFGVVAVFASVVSGCCGQQDIGTLAEDPNLRGELQTVPLTENAPNVVKAVVKGSALKSGSSYRMKEGILVIEGNIPPNTSVAVDNGRIEVTGNVGDKVELLAHMPERTHSESYTYTDMMPAGDGMVIPITQIKTHYVPDGLKYKSDDKGIDIHGSVGKDVKIESNAGVHVSGAVQFPTNIESGWGKVVLDGMSPQ